MARRLKDLFWRMKNWCLTRVQQQQEPCLSDFSQDDRITRALGPFEPYVIRVQSILIWENPLISALCVVIVNILFGLAVTFEVRFYGLIFSALLFGFVCDLWVERIWPEISVAHTRTTTSQDLAAAHSRVLTVPEISQYLLQAREILKDYYTWLKNLRDDQPGAFCCGMCLLFALLTLVGRAVPGAVLGYCLLTLVLTGPGVYLHLLPPGLCTRLHTAGLHLAALRPHAKGEGDSEVEEYLPEASCEALAVLQQAVEPVDEEFKDESLLVEEFGLDLSAAGAEFMPGHDEGSTDGLDLSEFDLSAPPSLGGSTSNSNHAVAPIVARRRHPVPPAHDGSESEEEEDVGDGIHFQSHHFNDSSEEEEQAFVQGLVFSEAGAAAAAATAAGSAPQAGVSARAGPGSSASLGEVLAASAAQAVAHNIAGLGALGSSLLSSVMGTAGPSQQVRAEPKADKRERGKGLRRDDSSSSGGESEFEMISHHDLT